MISVERRPRTAAADGVTVVEVRRRARVMLDALSLADAELSVLLTDDATIQSLNRSFRDKDKPTDVLAFAQREGEVAPRIPGAPELLGDVVISLPTASAQARARRRAPLAEVTTLLAHGLLHLVGYDHRDDEEEREMNAATAALVRRAARPRGKLSRKIADLRVRVCPATSRLSPRIPDFSARS